MSEAAGPLPTSGPLYVVRPVASAQHSAAAVAAMRQSAFARAARELVVLCPFGHCTIVYDLVERRIVGEHGPMGCAHSNLSGWASNHLDGLPKPRFAAKAKGRNRGRIERSVRRHQGVGRSGLMKWAESYLEETR